MNPVASAFRRNLAVCALALLGIAPAQRSPSVKDVMQRAGAYIAAYGEKASIVVCTEHYTQKTDGSTSNPETRQLLSDFAIVKADAIRGWLGFRDVLAVDGTQVSDREDRLAHVLLDAQGRYDEARRISDESSRYNLGKIERNFNVPTSALFFFVPENLDRFKFRARGVAEDGTWEIEFRETSKPTLIRTPAGESVFAFGTLWVRPQDGVVVRTHLQTELLTRGSGPQHGLGWIDVRFRRVDALGMWLPSTMDERFETTRREAWSKQTGHAEYSDYRVFTTTARIK